MVVFEQILHMTTLTFVFVAILVSLVRKKIKTRNQK